MARPGFFSRSWSSKTAPWCSAPIQDPAPMTRPCAQASGLSQPDMRQSTSRASLVRYPPVPWKRNRGRDSGVERDLRGSISTYLVEKEPRNFAGLRRHSGERPELTGIRINFLGRQRERPRQSRGTASKICIPAGITPRGMQIPIPRGMEGDSASFDFGCQPFGGSSPSSHDPPVTSLKVV
jgi:hypothetical protein